MKFRKISSVMAFVLLSLLFCPYMEAAWTSVPTNCHGEPAAPQSDRETLVCCGNDALPVQQIHAVILLPVLEILHPEVHVTSLASCFTSFEYPLLFRSTAEHLAHLSVLRL